MLKPGVEDPATIPEHTTALLVPEGDEYVPREYDEAGEKKIQRTGELRGNRDYVCRTFRLPDRGDKLFMVATHCARVLGYQESQALFDENKSLYKIAATQAEKENFINRSILSVRDGSETLLFVTAKSIYRQFGSRIIWRGRRVKDDYWEAKAREQGEADSSDLDSCDSVSATSGLSNKISSLGRGKFIPLLVE